MKKDDVFVIHYTEFQLDPNVTSSIGYYVAVCDYVYDTGDIDFSLISKGFTKACDANKERWLIIMEGYELKQL